MQSVCVASQREKIWFCIQGSIESDSLQDGMEETNYTLAQSSIPEMCLMTTTDRWPKEHTKTSGWSDLVALEMILFKFIMFISFGLFVCGC